MKPRFLAMVLTGLTALNLQAQSAYQKGWNAIINNQREEAIDQFKNVISSAGKDQDKAALALAMFSDGAVKTTLNFQNFLKFMQTSKDPYTIAQAIWYQEFAFSNHKLRKDQLALLKKMMADPKLNGTLIALANAQMGNFYRSQNNFKKAIPFFSKIGFIKEWQLAGTFQNISASGFDKPHAAITNADGKAKMYNPLGVQIEWFKLNQPRVDGWVTLDKNFDFSSHIAFAQTFANSPKDQWTYLRFGVSGSVKVWVNDVLVFSEFEERNNGYDAYNVKVKLNKGNNRILFQIGQTKLDRINFSARITDEKFNVLNDITYSAEYRNYTKGKAEFQVLENPVVEYCKEQIAKDSTELLNYFILGNAYFLLDRKEENLELLKELEKKYPNCALVKMKLAFVYNGLGNKSGTMSMLNWLKENDKKNPVVISTLFDDLIERKEYKEAEEYLEDYYELAGATETYYSDKITLELKNEGGELVSTIQKAYKAFPDYLDFNMYMSLVNQSSKNTAADYALWKKYISKNYSEGQLSNFVNAAFRVGKGTEALAFLQKAHENEPTYTWIAYTLAEIYSNSSVPKEAKKWADKAKENAPYTPSIWSLLSEIYEEDDDTEGAIDALKYCIELDPLRYEDRKRLRKLAGQEEDIFKKFTEIDAKAIAKKSPSKDEFPNENSMLLHKEVQRVFYGSGGSEYRVHTLVKVFTQEGVDDWKEYGTYGEIIKAEVIKANGTKIDAEIDEYSNQMVFTNLEPGDCIYVINEVQTGFSGALVRHSWDEMQFFYKELSFQKVKYSALVERGLNLNYAFSVGHIEPKIKEMGIWKLMTWEKDSFKAPKSENLMPMTKDVGEVLYVSTIPNWQFVNQWYQDLALAKSRSNYETRMAIKEIFQGVDIQNIDTLERARRIYQYITKNIRYSSVSFRQSGLIPQASDKVLNTKVGDCKDVSTLFVALCREAGIEAELVLVNGRNNGRKDMPLPHIGFDHCIARMKYKNEDYYIELTSDAIPFNSHHENLVDAIILPISNRGNDSAKIEHLNTKNRLQNVLGVQTTLIIEDDDIKVHREGFRTGAECASYRYTYKNLSAADKEKKFRENLREDYSNLEMDNLNLRNLDNQADSVNYSYDFVAEDVVTKAGGINILVIPWAHKDKPNDIFTNSKRQFPILYWQYASHDMETETITITLPAGKVLTDPLKNVKFSSAWADYSMIYYLYGNKLTITRTMIYKKGVIESSELKEFREFYKNVLTQDAKSLTYR